MSPTLKLLILLAIALSEAAITGFLVPRFFREGKTAAGIALIASAVTTVVVLAIVLFVVLD